MGARIISQNNWTAIRGGTAIVAAGRAALSRKIEWRVRIADHKSFSVSKFAQAAGPAIHVVATHLGGAEKVTYADI